MIKKRSMTGPEREFLEKAGKSAGGKWKSVVGMAFLCWFIPMVLFMLAWTFLAWLARITLGVEIGKDGPLGGWIPGLGALACGVFAVISVARAFKIRGGIRSDLRADLEDGQVVEESYRFTAAKRFQEPEHGGLIYFLRTTDDKVFVLYDHESQDLGVNSEDPLKSRFEPHAELTLVRAPKSKIVISKQFSGALLDAGAPRDLSIAPDQWPEPEEYCSIKWDNLDKRLNPPAKKARGR
ncbi:MAG: hypothetical protein EHM45_13690 [Desulfobacteraceae bacterium]|nr:MAG: hypothetical protein EHM45_13690 [Desulfobacteraceae bacterium]